MAAKSSTCNWLRHLRDDSNANIAKLRPLVEISPKNCTEKLGLLPGSWGWPA